MSIKCGSKIYERAILLRPSPLWPADQSETTLSPGEQTRPALIPTSAMKKADHPLPHPRLLPYLFIYTPDIMTKANMHGEG